MRLQTPAQFFAPKPGQVRARDILRQIPASIGPALGTVLYKKPLQMIGEGATRGAISAYEAPRQLAGKAQTTGYHNVPFIGRVNSFQDEAKNRVNMGQPLWRAAGNPMLDTVMAGADVAAAARPLVGLARSFKPAMNRMPGLANFLDDMSVPLGRTRTMVNSRVEPVSPDIFDRNPYAGSFKPAAGGYKKVAGFDYDRIAEPHRIETTTQEPFYWKTIQENRNLAKKASILKELWNKIKQNN